jgi:hypothetical protein
MSASNLPTTPTIPAIPTVADLASDVLTHQFDDMFNPPGLTNFLGAVQVDHDLVAVRSVNFPPLSHGDTVTGSLFVDGRLFRSFGTSVDVVWRPDQVHRRSVVDGLTIETVTACPPDVSGVVVDIRVTNSGDEARSVDLGLAVASTVTQSAKPWLRPEPPGESNTLEPVAGRDGVIVGRAGATAAVSVQGLDAGSTDVETSRLGSSLRLAPGESARVGYVHVVGADEDAALGVFDQLAADVPGAIRAAEDAWNAALAAAFTPGSGQFSGSLPVLETSNEALRRLYWWGVVGTIWFRRDNPASVMGRTYDTLMPRYWQTTTFIWDYSLSSFVHGLLDPDVMRRHISHWVATDIHTHFGTEWLTGGPVGNWYSVNDFAMTRLVRDYVRLSGDRAFLDHELAAADGPSRPLREHVEEWSLAWKSLRRGSALADYGEIDNLLECVSTYVHEVASLNSTNVWCLRVAAEVAAMGGDEARAKELRAEADELVGHVLELYVDGGGFFHARHPDGTLVPVRHCYDFSTVGLAIPEDLSAAQRDEMVAYFRRELQTPSWMRALSPYDPDATYSVRPDHQWNGAYPAWPADAARALVALGAGDVVLDWVPGLARTANQGPPGQAHFVEEAEPPVNGGAVKSPPQFPYLIDWACSSAGSWASLVIESIFGVGVSLDGTVTANPIVGDLDPDARLTGLIIDGTSYDVTATGIAPSSSE